MISELNKALNRRKFLSRTGAGVGSLALGSLLGKEATAASMLAPFKKVAPKAQSVIFFHMTGAPSHLDLFDEKPVLKQYDRKLAPKELFEGKRFSFLRGHPKLLGSPYEFIKHGQSGNELSELLPNLGTVADEMCIIKSMHTTEFNHGPAQLVFHTGLNRQGNPSIGSWTTYGLGSESENLPAYVVFLKGNTPGAGANLWKAGFLPSVHQGVQLRGEGEPVLYLKSPKDVSREDRRRTLDSIEALNRQNLELIGDPEIQTRIDQYEMAYRMQASVPDLVDLSQEEPKTLEMYGDTEFAGQCLKARRLVERGVRFVELFHGDWDTHSNQKNRLAANCKEVDQPITALITDLKRRGLLDSTLIVWGAEFGRTPMLQGTEDPEKCGRDHQKDAYTVWMAGGGIKGGVTYGKTNDLGNEVAENPTEVRDLHATILHLLGIDHDKLTYRYQGFEQKLTGVEEAHVLRELLV
ncbi:MAG: sulfatase [Verrucomicrobiales bacterium]|nr:sulfatase [Verrucomicrobiales bacterium]